MKKLNNCGELLWVFGIIFIAFGVAVCDKANLGVSMVAAPAFVIAEALNSIFPFITVGVTEYLFQGLLLIILCFSIRKFNWLFLLSFGVAFVYGYVLDFFIWALSPIVINSVVVKWIMLLVGDILVAFGVACCFKTYLPLQVYELFVSAISNKFKLEITKVKRVFDISLLFLSIILATTLFGDVLTFDFTTIYKTSFHSIGLGTIVTTIINSFLISLSSKFIDKCFDNSARFLKLENLLKQKY
ncbi:MAG: hypothetical protein J6R29_02385 [Clostridia bacterium]|nr:hypothetical protein [Clostridia bacterium]